MSLEYLLKTHSTLAQHVNEDKWASITSITISTYRPMQPITSSASWSTCPHSATSAKSGWVLPPLRRQEWNRYRRVHMGDGNASAQNPFFESEQDQQHPHTAQSHRPWTVATPTGQQPLPWRQFAPSSSVQRRHGSVSVFQEAELQSRVEEGQPVLEEEDVADEYPGHELTTHYEFVIIWLFR